MLEGTIQDGKADLPAVAGALVENRWLSLQGTNRVLRGWRCWCGQGAEGAEERGVSNRKGTPQKQTKKNNSIQRFPKVLPRVVFSSINYFN
jgi:hypothetical protein